jgi:hypothetical protein
LTLIIFVSDLAPPHVTVCGDGGETYQNLALLAAGTDVILLVLSAPPAAAVMRLLIGQRRADTAAGCPRDSLVAAGLLCSGVLLVSATVITILMTLRAVFNPGPLLGCYVF